MMSTVMRGLACSRSLPTWAAVTAASLVAALAVAAPASASFGIQSFDGSVTNQDGTGGTQAGAHGWGASTTIEFPTTTDSNGNVTPDGNVRDLEVGLPAGFVGDPSAAAKCTDEQLDTFNYATYTPNCPLESQVGIVSFTQATGGTNLTTLILPVYNLVPPRGVPAAFGFLPFILPLRLRASVRAGGDYGLTMSMRDVAQSTALVRVTLTLWGVPADPSHDGDRGNFCQDSGFGPFCFSSTGHPSSASRKPFLINPMNCSAGPLTTTLRADSWQHPGDFKTASFVSHLPGGIAAGASGCEKLPFDPALTMRATEAAAGSPAGYTVDLHMPYMDNPDGLSEAALKKVTVELPQGVSVSPSAANGLGACDTDQIGIDKPNEPTCPDSSKIGTVNIDTPLLSQPMTGSVYLARPTPTQLLKIYLVAEGSGVLVKLPGTIEPDPDTGQLTATFDDNPQLPFTDLHVEFKDGARAPLTTPKACGTYTTHAEFTAWSGQTASSDDAMTIDQGCDRARKFEPTLSAGVTNPVAGGSSSFVLNVERPDGQQDISSMNITLPPGVLAHVGRVPLCPEDQAIRGACSAASQVGTTTVASGAGTSPISIPQAGNVPTAVYLAGAYKGAPYSLSIVVPAQAGPFDLGVVVVRAALFIDPVDAHVSVQSDAIPTILKGIPLDLQRITVTIDRPGFTVSPTSCDPMQIRGQVTSAQGTAATVQDRFQVGDCASLDLKPRLALSLSGKGQTTDNKHPGLSASLTMPSGQANLKKVAVTLPLSLALDPNNSQSDSLCDFEAGRKTIPECPASSIVGRATARTPLLSEPLSGPVYFVKNVRTDAKTGRQIRTLPTLAIPLQGAGITLVLRASSEVVDDHLVTTFDKIPDAPVSDFKLNINGGSQGILVVSGADICKATQTAGQAVDGQNGKTADAEITISTPCALAVVASSHTRSTLKVTVGGIGAGKVWVSGKGIARTSRTITTATTATLQPKLSNAAQSTLARGHDIRTRVKVSFMPRGAKKAKTAHKTLMIHGAKK